MGLPPLPKGSRAKKTAAPLAIMDSSLVYNPARKQAQSVDGTPQGDQKRQEAQNFIKKLKKEKAEREQNLKFMTDAKDN